MSYRTPYCDLKFGARGVKYRNRRSRGQRRAALAPILIGIVVLLALQQYVTLAPARLRGALAAAGLPEAQLRGALPQEGGQPLRESQPLRGDVSPTPPPAPGAPSVAPELQMRAWWVDAFHDGVKTPAQVDQLIADARSAGVNTLIVQVRRRGDAYYNRTAEPRTEDPALMPGFDALQWTIERARAAEPRLEVHAWVATVALWNRRERPPADPRHAANLHGATALGTDNWISLDDAGAAWDGDNYMLDPGHPGAARYIAEVAAEIVREYDVDGLHLDLVRYAGVQWGYNPVSVERFRRRYGAAGGAPGRPAPNDPRWQQWRRDQVTALVRRIYLDTLAIRPRVKVSAATIGWGTGPVDERTWRATSAYRNVFQDWLGWIEEGILDVVMPMNYDNDREPSQRLWFDQWTAWQKERKGKRHVVAGVGLFLNEPAGGLSQVRRALEPSPTGARLDGVALYSYAVSNAPRRGGDRPTTPNGDLFRALVEPGVTAGDGPPPFARPAVPPPMPWKDNPAAHLRGTARRTGGDAPTEGAPLDGATVRLTGPVAATLQTDGNGVFGAPGLPPGRYVATLDVDGVTLTATSIVLVAGEVAWLDLVASG